MRTPKESPWKLSEPASFRSWLKGSMKPVGYDKALKKKKNLAIAYFFMSLFTLNSVIWSHIKRKEDTVTPEHEVVQEYLTTTPPDKADRQVYVYNYENLKFKDMEHIDLKEMENRRRE